MYRRRKRRCGRSASPSASAAADHPDVGRRAAHLTRPEQLTGSWPSPPVLRFRCAGLAFPLILRRAQPFLLVLLVRLVLL